MSYPGAKGQAGVFQRIIGNMPPHNYYIEAFCGSGVIFKAKRPASDTLLIDKHAPCLTPFKRIPGVVVHCADFCELQGLPRDFDLPGLSLAAKYRAVGNGVPVQMARVLARAVKAWSVTKTLSRVCICHCGRPVPAGKTLATAGCRKRMQRTRDAAGVSEPEPVTPAQSLLAV